MSDQLTPSQTRAADELIAKWAPAGEGKGTIEERASDGTVIYRIAAKRWAIGPRGKVEDLHDAELESSAGDLPPEPEPSDITTEGQRPVDPGANPRASAAPSSAALASPEDPQLYQALTEADERQIIAEIEGRAVSAMVYSYRQGGGLVTGLSWVGVQEAIRQMNTRRLGRINVTDLPPIVEEITVDVDTGRKDDDGRVITESRLAVRVQVYARDEVYGSARWGTATQLREYKARTKKDKQDNPLWFPDPFADAKALSKAQRNAMEGMLPLSLVEELKAAYVGKGKVEYIEATAVDVTELPPALDDKRAKQLGDEIRELYANFKQAHPNGLKTMPPAEFNRYFVAAQHSHERLEDFKTHMEQKVTEAEEVADG